MLHKCHISKHYRRGVRCIMLWREALLHMRLKNLRKHVEHSIIKSRLEILRNALNGTQEVLHKAHHDLQEEDEISPVNPVNTRLSE